MSFQLEHTIALAIDLQERLIPAMDHSKELIEQTRQLIEGLHELKIPILFTQQYTKGLGMTLEEFQFNKDSATFSYIEKISFSSVKEPKLLEQLEKYQPGTILVFGVEAHICVLQTLLDLKQKGYQVVMVTDCMSSRHQKDYDMAIQRAIMEGIIPATKESVLFELMESAKHEKFKAISNLIK